MKVYKRKRSDFSNSFQLCVRPVLTRFWYSSNVGPIEPGFCLTYNLCYMKSFINGCKSWITLLHQVLPGHFWINGPIQTLRLSVHEMMPMRAFWILQKWSEMAEMTPDDLLILEMILSESPRYIEQNTILVS